MRRIGIAVAIAYMASSVGSLRAAESPSEETRRLVEVCNLWGYIGILHPYVWTRDVDWDAALVAALPKIRAARNEDEYAAAMGEMLATLKDPATRVTAALAPTAPHAAKTAPLMEWLEPGTLLLRLTGAVTPKTPKEIEAELPKAKRVIVDLRTATRAWSPFNKLVYAKLVTHDLRVPPLRYVVHNGYRSQTMGSTGGYYSALEERGAEVTAEKPSAVRRRIAFLVNRYSRIPEEALALQASGEGVIVGHGSGFEELAVSSSIPIGEKHRMLVRTFEYGPLGAVTPHLDAELAADAGDEKVLKAAQTALARPPAKGKPQPPLPPMRWHADKTYADMKAPDVEHRLLGLFRLWTVIDTFYPYKSLLDEKWDDVLTAFIPRVIAAEGRQAWAEVLAELSTHIEDTHVHIRGADDLLGCEWAGLPFGARMIEHQAAVVFVEAAGRALGIHEGDVIVAVDGEPIEKRMARLRRFTPASNEPEREFMTMRSAIRGVPEPSVKLTFRDAKGQTREVSVPRTAGATKPVWRDGEIVRILDGNVGYVDLDRLEAANIDAMFDKLAKTRAIIFDMRGYPNGVFGMITPRLNARGATVAAKFTRPIVSGDASIMQGTFGFDQEMGRADPTRIYRGKTFMLVDERTISQSEHTGLWLEAAAGTKFVGSTTSGSNGDVTDLTLPGGLSMTFSGHEVRHADGRQLQRVGLPIDIKVTPTLAGIRAGRDEVLERALAEAKK